MLVDYDAKIVEVFKRLPAPQRMAFILSTTLTAACADESQKSGQQRLDGPNLFPEAKENPGKAVQA